MGNIFETALRESAENTFRASGKIGYMMLNNFGAILALMPDMVATVVCFMGDFQKVNG